ncbi:GNAT family N-acetyltransferase [Tabrizicola sp.]|uniref:GNAT family N-acetyltransferase n=1 Tax=Tabrizicola sp. TaxID=2005166 RepID=UPI00286B7FF1|nr:GNAT family N-acetyltransferase [Tabrizicola sp.]
MVTTIRPYVADDWQAADLVYYRAIREGTGDIYSEAQRIAWAPDPILGDDTPDKLLDQWCWVAEAEGRMTGFMSLCPDGLLDMAFVIPEARGDGTAATLYDTLIAKARAETLPRLTVIASPFSHRFLLKRGWQVDSDGPEVHDGQTYHLYHMSLDLRLHPSHR